MSDQKNGTCDEKVMDSLYIPLYARAKENRVHKPIIKDEKAEDIIRCADLNGKIIDGGSISTLGIISRTKIIDDEVCKLLSNGKKTVIINLGVGLDTRIARLNTINVHWYDIDFPEVIELRRAYFNQYNQTTLLAESILEYGWIEKIDTSNTDNVIIIAEGLLMYLTESQIRKLFRVLCVHFPEAHMFFDVVHTYFVGKKISTEFKWGIDQAAEIHKYGSDLFLINSWSAGDLNKERQSKVMRILNVFPSTKNRSQILHLTLGVKGDKDAKI